MGVMGRKARPVEMAGMEGMGRRGKLDLKEHQAARKRGDPGSRVRYNSRNILGEEFYTSRHFLKQQHM